MSASSPSDGKLIPQPLPENHYPDDTEIRRAYDQCLALEQRDAWSVVDDGLQNEAITTNLSPRVLGQALLLAPSEEGRDALTRDIIGCNGDFGLLAGLAHLFVYGLIRLCELLRDTLSVAACVWLICFQSINLAMMGLLY